MQISVDTAACVGGGACVLAAPDVFDQREEDGTVILLDDSPGNERLAAVERAVLLCPARAISIQT